MTNYTTDPEYLALSVTRNAMHRQERQARALFTRRMNKYLRAIRTEPDPRRLAVLKENADEAGAQLRELTPQVRAADQAVAAWLRANRSQLPGC